MANILFLNPPSLKGENVIRDCIYGCWCKGKRIGGAMTPPYPQLELATLMKQFGHQVEVVDAMAEGLGITDIEKRVVKFDYLVLLTSVTTFGDDAVILERLKKASAQTVMIVYGSLPTFLPDMALKTKGVDIIIRREAEYALRDFVGFHSKNDSRWIKVPGVGFAEKDGTFIINDFYPFIENLDELPPVDWGLLKNNKKYFNPSVKRFPYVTELVTRGCYWNCIFCMSPGFYGHKARTRSPENILSSLEKYAAEGIKEIYFRDEMFTAFPANVRAICRGIIKKKLDLTWIASVRAGSITFEDLKLMKEAGCHLIKVGAESGSQEILDKAKKQITLKQVTDLFEWARGLKVDTHAHFMIGFPQETVETIKMTIKHAIRLRPTTVTFAILTPYPGTPIFDRVADKYPDLVKEYSLELSNLHINPFRSDAYCEVPAEDLAKWVYIAHRKFYLRPSYIIERLINIKSRQELMNTLKAGFKIISFSIFGETEDKRHG